MSERNKPKRSKTYRENKKKRKIEESISSCAMKQTNKQSYEHDTNESVSGIIKIEPKESNPNEEDKLMLELAENCSPSPPTWPFYTVELGSSANRVKIEPDVFTQESGECSTVQNNVKEHGKQQQFLAEIESVTKSVQMSSKKKSNSTKSNDKETDSVRELNENQNYNQIHQLENYIEGDCLNLQTDIGTQILNIVRETNAIAHENKVKLDTLTKKLNTIKENQTTIINFLLNKQLVDIEPIDFKKIYNLEIPCKELEDFQYLDELLEHNDLFKSDVITQLTNCIDKRDCSLTKSFANMLRLFMTSNTLSNFTAIRKSTKSDKDRQIFASTNLYKLMSGIVTKERKDKNLAHDTKDLHSALSDVISHSGKWPS